MSRLRTFKVLSKLASSDRQITQTRRCQANFRPSISCFLCAPPLCKKTSRRYFRSRPGGMVQRDAPARRSRVDIERLGGQKMGLEMRVAVRLLNRGEEARFIGANGDKTVAIRNGNQVIALQPHSDIIPETVPTAATRRSGGFPGTSARLHRRFCRPSAFR